MHTAPSTHPNQVRSACERCRRQKLRCSRPVGPVVSCARCSRLNLTCQPGLQRRVGRPPKKDLQVVVHEPADDGMQFIQGLLDDSAWNLDPFCGYAPEGLPFPMEAWPAVQSLDASDIEQPVIRPGEHLFETLSKLNAEIHRGREFTAQFKSNFDMSDFICKVRNTMNGYENVQMVLRTAQEFLVVLKSLHRQLGTRTVSCYGRQPYTHKAIKALAADAPSSPVSPLPSLSSGAASPTSRTGSATPQLPPVFDSPTMFLIISCYVQLIQHLEFILKMNLNTIQETHRDLMDAASMSFADVPLLEPSTQFVLFSELLRHVVTQLNLLIGFPSPWSSKSAWTGLVSSQRYKDMLNSELGAVEDGWTTRPSKLLELNRITKGMLEELTMMGVY
ncbi:uncharacterized protein B0J16DRAFT_374577 [Fusarium flagelliforme]|uniref:Zn(2)-C6 fungal-type domain-containing protein n=1 Tax=Fusarium flagelliforme TaxID=2675880 RepID=A0A395MNA6_9HYPO|nr:uncharacterized protein B0J16DRAFT_374577 [Fusarium flagelliforme]KAH7179559.1 hypothetical protein B0J16DRAFT_374577 [Fusarium flagelliforme]RFN49392.1 hypothetical protein FIE12Z_6287 [Fusarium flagelliforme]